MIRPRSRAPWFRDAGALAMCVVLPSLSVLAVAACAASDVADGPDADGRLTIPSGDAGNEASAADVSVDAQTCAAGDLCSAPTPLTVGFVTAISGRSKNDVWASATGGVLMHWDGHQWRGLASDYSDTLSSIYLTPDEMWGISGNLVLRREIDPSSVRTARVNLFQNGPYRSLSGIAVFLAGGPYVIVAPGAYTPAPGQFVAKLDFDASGLTYLPDPILPGGGRAQYVAFRASFLVPNTALWIVGDQAVVARYPVSAGGAGGSSPIGEGAVFSIPFRSDLLAVWGYGEQLWAAGRNGTILHFDGANWNTEKVPTKVNLNAIFGLSPNDIWAAGDNGTVLHFDGNAWSPVGGGAYSGSLKAVWAAAPDDVWIGGEGGMFHWGALP
jgi:hypothetical protein